MLPAERAELVPLSCTHIYLQPRGNSTHSHPRVTLLTLNTGTNTCRVAVARTHEPHAHPSFQQALLGCRGVNTWVPYSQWAAMPFCVYTQLSTLAQSTLKLSAALEPRNLGQPRKALMGRLELLLQLECCVQIRFHRICAHW